MRKLLFIASLLLAASSPTWAADTLMPFNEAGKWGYITRDSKRVEFVLQPTYELAYPFREGLSAVRQDGLWGFIDTKGSLVIPYKYEALGSYEFRGGIVLVKKGELFGAIDRTGKEVLPIKFLRLYLNEKTGTLIGNIKDPADPNSFEGLVGMYDLTGKPLLSHEYSSIGPWFKNNTTSVTKNKLKALVNNKGKLLTSLQYSGTYYTDLDHFITERGKDEGYDLYDADGRLYFKSNHSFVGALIDNRAKFKDRETKNYGFLNSKGEVVIPAEFNNAEKFSEGLAFVQRKSLGSWEVIDVNGKVIGAVPNSDSTNGFKNGFAWVRDKTDLKYYCYNRQLQKVFAQGFEYADHFDKNKLARVTVAKNQIGILDTKGQWVLKPEYNKISFVEETGQYIAEKDPDVFLVDVKGAIIFRTNSVVIAPYDEQFYSIKPQIPLVELIMGNNLNGNYHCMLRKDGVPYYVATKPQ